MKKAFLLICLVTLQGCARAVTSEDWKEAVLLCVHHEGVKKVYNNLGISRMQIECEDGIEIEVVRK